MKTLKENIKNLKMTNKNIKKKNIASIITLVSELLKVIILLIFLQSINKTFAKAMLVFSIFTTILALFILFNDNYKKTYKYMILDLSALIFFFSNIVGGLLIESVILDVVKGVFKDFYKNEKIKKLPIILYHNKLVYLYLFISIIIGYEFLYINSLLFYILVFTSLIAFFKDDLINSLKQLKKQKNKFIKYIVKNYINMLLISGISFLIIGIIVGNVSTNEQLLNENLLFTSILSILYAPIAEELLFRGCLRKIIKNDILFIIISGISFGAWHVIGYDQSLLQYLYIIPYSIIGIFLSSVYSKTNNLTTNIGVHALNNIIASIMNLL